LTENERDRLYVYGIVPSGGEIDFGGEAGERVYAIPYCDIAAVVSIAPARDYASMSREELIRKLARHQQVVEQIMRRREVLPVKFGTTLEDRAEVLQALKNGYSEFKAALAKLHDKVQVEVVASWDLQAVLEEIAQEAPLSELKAKIGEDASSASIPDRIRLGEAIKQSLDRRRERYQQEAIAPLAGCAVETRLNPLFDDSLVLNVAMLLLMERLPELDDRLDRLDAALDGRLTFRRVGPLPPYSFSTVEIRRISPEEVRQARERLALPPEAGPEQVKQAYYRQARKFHPDGRAGDSADSVRFAEVRSAAKLLTSCVCARRNGRKAGAGPRVVGAEGAILVSIGPTGGDVP
jgi:hypothetical protein